MSKGGAAQGVDRRPENLLNKPLVLDILIAALT